MNKVWVQLGENGLASEIFKNQKEMFFRCPPDREAEMERRVAVGQIRDQLYEQQGGICARCPALITRNSAHMHERQHRGQFDENGRSGRISLSNSEMLCCQCHIGPFGAHRHRALTFSTSKERK